MQLARKKARFWSDSSNDEKHEEAALLSRAWQERMNERDRSFHNTPLKICSVESCLACMLGRKPPSSAQLGRK